MEKPKLGQSNTNQIDSEMDKMTGAHYTQALVETIREPFLVLDSDLRVVKANKTFLDTFGVGPTETEKKLVYELGNGQWNIESLKELLENILPKKKIVMDYEVKHNFPTIGTKIMLLNAYQIDSVQLILLAFEDITDRKLLEKSLREHATDLANKITERTAQLSSRVKELEQLNQDMVGRELKMVELKKEIVDLKLLVEKNSGT